MTKPVIAIDGPAASGKGTLARTLAKNLNFAYLDTGALYRAVGYMVLQSGQDPADEEAAETAAMVLCNSVSAEFLANPALKTDEAGQAASQVATMPHVRNALLTLQKDFAKHPPHGAKGAILDGRDIGTVICPDAPLKLFVTANTEIRAERRLKELQSKGIAVTYEAVLKDMRERDARDTSRTTAPMKPADDAIILDSSHLTAEDVLEQAQTLVKIRLDL